MNEPIKPCSVCGVDIHPLATKYPRTRSKCDPCVKKVAKEKENIRQLRYRAKKRKLLMGMGITKTYDKCIVCHKDSPSNRSKYCSDVCAKKAILIKSNILQVAYITKRLEELRAKRARIKKDLKRYSK